MFIHRLLDTPKNQLKAFAFAGVVAAQIVAGTTLAAHADTPDDAILAPARAEARQLAQRHGDTRQVSAQQLLALAESQVGIAENGAGGGTKFHRWYMDSPRAHQTVARDTGTIAGYTNAAWCDMFVSWVGSQLGIQDTVGVDAYTVEHAKWFASQERWGTTPRPGAVVFFAWKGTKKIDDIEHVGFLVKDNGDGTVKTVEGNTGNGKVEIRTRSTDDIAGYGYPGYAI